MLHIRCKTCELHIAGPLTPKARDRRLVLLANDYLTIRDRDDLPTAAPEGFDGEDPLDIYAHGQWCLGGCDLNKSERTADWGPKLNPETYGCCGPSGNILCSSCNSNVGFIYADCCDYHPLIRFDHNKIDRSDEVDGWWTIHENGMEQWGQFVDGERDEEWQCFSYYSNPRELLRIELWENGNLLKTVT
jgi:hypothetical protein